MAKYAVRRTGHNVWCVVDKATGIIVHWDGSSRQARRVARKITPKPRRKAKRRDGFG